MILAERTDRRFHANRVVAVRALLERVPCHVVSRVLVRLDVRVRLVMAAERVPDVLVRLVRAAVVRLRVVSSWRRTGCFFLFRTDPVLHREPEASPEHERYGCPSEQGQGLVDEP